LAVAVARVAGLREPISHYTDAMRFGSLLFVSGMGPLDEQGALVGRGDAAEQTRQILRNLDRVLRAAGASPADVLEVTVYLTDIADRSRINPPRQEFFGTARPPSTRVEVSKLAIPGIEGEIEAVVRPGRREGRPAMEHWHRRPQEGTSDLHAGGGGRTGLPMPRD
jgi:enamine deaminase RidA (YjgF/YER057c/UK114 family)